MARPSIKDQRSAEILDAYLTCVARFGLEGATQERIAEEAGIKRPLLRHYLGNRDEMIIALAAHVVAGFARTTDAIGEALQPEGTATDLVNLLFSGDAANDPRLMLAYQALVASAPDYPAIRQPLLDSLTHFFDMIDIVLMRSAPGAPIAQVRAVTQGIAATFVNLDALSPLKPPAEWREDLRQAAMILAASLETCK